MLNARLDEAQAGIKIVGRNIRRMKHICSSGLTNTMQSSIIIHIKLYFQCNIFMSSFSIIPSKEIPGLISFRMNWLDLLAV